MTKQLVKVLEQAVVTPLCLELETELRLAAHQEAGLQLEDRNPWRFPPPRLQPFLKLTAIIILGTRLNVRARVEHYLSTTFYNLTTVSLANWKRYGEMRHLASARLGLNTVQDRLPSATLEQVWQLITKIGRFKRNKSQPNNLTTIYLYNFFY